MIDTHIHLDQLEDAEAQLEEAAGEGVEAVVAVGVDLATSATALEFARRRPGVWAAVGHHPLNSSPPDLLALRALAQDQRVVAVGEVGLDHADPERGPEDEQEEWFEACCGLALSLQLPVLVHVRETAEQVLAQLSAHRGLTGVIHYWTLDWAWAERFLAAGFHISFSGLVTRASRDDLRRIAAALPEDRILLETDAPWGTPRGRSGPMRAAWIKSTLEVVAEARGLTPEEMSELEWANALRLFRRLQR